MCDGGRPRIVPGVEEPLGGDYKGSYGKTITWANLSSGDRGAGGRGADEL